jgi:WD40 repeat protein
MPHTTDARESVWAEHEQVLRRFEDAWGGGRPDLAAFRPADARHPAALLAELVQIELEFRYRAGERPRVEEYVGRFPELADDRLLLELLASELALRERHGQTCEADELADRFPHLVGRLDPLLTTRPHRHRTPWNAAVKPTLPGYAVGDQLGRGGMGVVYRAEQASPARTVAVKTLLDVPDDRTAARFRREAQAMARLDHPHIVPVYEVGEWASGTVRLPYFTMKWYAGGSLDAAACGPGTAVAEHARLVETVARAVHHAHQRGVLHRDLKPSNILLDADGRPAVADFGLAGQFDPDAPAPMSKSVVGTPAYMAPEQARDPAGVTTAADVYGLGAILYHLLTGRPPVAADNPVAALQLLGRNAPDRPSAVNPAVPRDLETVCLKCLEADPRSRYPSADAVADDLARWRNGESIAARRPGPAERVWRAVRRHPVVTALSLATAAAVVFALLTLSLSVRRVREKEAVTNATLDREQQALYLERVAAVGRLYRTNHLEQAWHTLAQCPERLQNWEWHYLNGVRLGSGGTALAHGDSVLGADFLADGQAATAERGGLVRVWKTGVGPPVATALAARGTTVCGHPTRNLLAVRNAKRVAVVDADADRELFHTDGDGWFSFTPDGEHLIVAHRGVLNRFAVSTWEPTGELAGHTKAVICGAFSPDGNTLYTGSDDMFVFTWDWRANREQTRRKRDGRVLHLAVSADGKSVFETIPALLQVTDLATGRSRRLTEVSVSRPILLPTFDPTGYVGTTGLGIGEIVMRDLEPGEPKRVYRGHLGPVNAAAVSRDGKRLITAGDDATARLWDLTTSAEYTDLVAPPFDFGAPCLSADGRLVAVVSRNVHDPRGPVLPVYDAGTGREVFRVNGVGDATFDPRGRWLAAGRRDGSVGLHDPADGTERRVLKAGARAPTGLYFRPDGEKLAAVEMLGSVRVWDTTTWEMTEYTPAKSVSDVAWSPDGRRLAITDGAEVVFWDPSTGAVELRFAPATTPLVLAYSPDGQNVAVAGRGRSLELFDTTTGERRVECIGNPSVANGLAFHPSGTRLASVGVYGFIRVWDTASGKEVLTLSGGSDLMGVAWSADGKHLYASGATLRRWSAGD